MVEGKRTAAGVRAHAQAAEDCRSCVAVNCVGNLQVRLRRECPTIYQRRRGRHDRSRCPRGAWFSRTRRRRGTSIKLGDWSGFSFSPRAAFATEYMSRGTTQSAHQPAAGAVIETTLADKLYASADVTSVRLPGDATAEVALSYGIGPSFSSVDFDISWNYYAYPGQGAATANGGSQYGEGVVRADTKFGEKVHFAAGFAVSPNYSNTGAWSEYTAAGLGYELPRSALPEKVGAVVSGGAGYFVFGNQSAAIAGFPLPAYLNWNLGVTFERGNLHFDLRYFDSNLSKASCFVLTGDPERHGGRAHQPTHQSARPRIQLVQRYLGRQILVRAELRIGQRQAG